MQLLVSSKRTYIYQGLQSASFHEPIGNCFRFKTSTRLPVQPKDWLLIFRGMVLKINLDENVIF